MTLTEAIRARTLTEVILRLDDARKALIRADALWSQGTAQTNVDAAGYEEAAWTIIRRLIEESPPSKVGKR